MVHILFPQNIRGVFPGKKGQLDFFQLVPVDTPVTQLKVKE